MGITTFLAQMTQGYDGSHQALNDDPAIANAAMTVVAAGSVVLLLVIVAAIYVVTSLALARIFKKAGIEESWKAWVPIYNSWILLELGGQKGYWAIVALIPVVNLAAGVFMIIAMYHISLKLGKDDSFVLLAIFLPIIWMAWLALDKSTWQGAKPAVVAVPPKGPASSTPPAAQAK
jgi:hypothetical protein